MKSSSSRDLDGKTSKQWSSAGFTILLLVHKINSKYRGKARALKQSGPGLKCCLSLLLWIRMDFRQTYSLGLLSDAIPGTFDLCFPGIYSKHAGIYWGYFIPVTCRCSHKFLKRERKKKKKESSSGRIITLSSRYWRHLYLHLALWAYIMLPPALCNWYHKFLHP